MGVLLMMLAPGTPPTMMVRCFPADNVTAYLMMMAPDTLPRDDG